MNLSTNSLFSSKLTKVGLFIGVVLLIICSLSYSNNLYKTNSKDFPSSIINNNSSKTESSKVKRKLEELFYRSTMLMERQSTAIQSYSSSNIEHPSFMSSLYSKSKVNQSLDKHLLAKRRENFTNTISQDDKCTSLNNKSKEVVPYNLGRDSLKNNILDNTSSFILPIQTVIDISSMNSFMNIDNYYKQKADMNKPDCFYLHMLIPGEVLQRNNLIKEKSDSYWELGCRVFEFRQIIDN